MKIIGITKIGCGAHGAKTDGYILEASSEEIYHLIGYYYKGCDGAPSLGIGSEIAVNDMYHKLSKLADQAREVSSAQKVLRSAADLLELPRPLLESVGKDGDK